MNRSSSGLGRSLRVDQIRFQLTDKRYGNVKEKHVSRYLLQLLAAITTGDWLTPALDLPTIVNIHHVVTLEALVFLRGCCAEEETRGSEIRSADRQPLTSIACPIMAVHLVENLAPSSSPS